jgi:hypothetical protein
VPATSAVVRVRVIDHVRAVRVTKLAATVLKLEGRKSRARSMAALYQTGVNIWFEQETY